MGLVPYAWRRSVHPVALTDGPGVIDHVVITGTLAGGAATTSQLTATAYTALGAVVLGAAVVWRAVSPRFVTVSSTGLLTFVLDGSSVIIATVDGRDYTVTATTTASIGNQDFFAPAYFGHRFFSGRYFG